MWIKWLIIPIIFLFLFGCSSINPQIIKLDKENYEANKALAKETLKTWSFNSGFIKCAGLADKIIFPIQNAGQVRAVLNNPSISLGLAELDQLAKDLNKEDGQPYWSDEDEALGCSLGIKARLAVVSVIDIAKMFPKLAPYLSFIP